MMAPGPLRVEPGWRDRPTGEVSQWDTPYAAEAPICLACRVPGGCAPKHPLCGLSTAAVARRPKAVRAPRALPAEAADIAARRDAVHAALVRLEGWVRPSVLWRDLAAAGVAVERDAMRRDLAALRAEGRVEHAPGARGGWRAVSGWPAAGAPAGRGVAASGA